MKQGIFTIEKNRKLAPSVYEMILTGDTSGCQRPGQFINIRIDELFLRRPISVCDYSENGLKIIYKVVGKGTRAMADMRQGESLDVLTGLGNGYDIEKAGKNPVLIGGGVGIPPLYGLVKALKAKGEKDEKDETGEKEEKGEKGETGWEGKAEEKIRSVRVILGFNTAEEIFYKEEFEEAGAKVLLATRDGSDGIRGLVTDVLSDMEYSYFYACGPEAMLRAIEGVAKTSGQYSFEERMGCGFGACMGCSCETKYGSKRICKDGPVLEREEILW